MPVASLFELNPESPSAHTNADLPLFIKRVRNLDFNPESLNEATLALDLFGERVTAVRTQLERDQPGQQVWVGHLEGNTFDTVVVTQVGQEVSAMIQRGDNIYSIGQGLDGKKQLQQYNLEALPPDHPAEHTNAKSTEKHVEHDKTSVDISSAVASADAPPQVSGDGSHVQQDLLVVYTEQACASAGSCNQMKADIVTAVADLNQVYRASGIRITMKLVGTAKTTYNAKKIDGALYKLSDENDDVMDEVHTLRNKLGADLVSLIIPASDYCGEAWVGGGAGYGFSVVARGCMLGNRSLAHELGHNQGALHDRITEGATSRTASNYGFRRCQGGGGDDRGAPYFRTVMSYDCKNTPRIGLFSNPQVIFNGVSAGINPKTDPANGAWNADKINQTAASKAAFRKTKAGDMPLTAPTSLTAKAASSKAMNLSWKDNATGEDSYIVQRSTTGNTWSDIATLEPNTVFYADNAVVAHTTYYYRVAAKNSAGVSFYSNTVSVATPAAPAPSAGSWSQVAVEWSSFTLPAPALVRYGLNNAWVERQLSGKAECTNRFFGVDPLRGTVKVCQVFKGQAANR